MGDGEQQEGQIWEAAMEASHHGLVPEAMRAAWILKREFGYDTRILNLHTLKPIDEPAII
jgi:transketolase N-terminal domain/subunit